VLSTAAFDARTSPAEATLVRDTFGFVVDVSFATPAVRNFLMVTSIYSTLNANNEIVNMVRGILPSGDEVDIAYQNDGTQNLLPITTTRLYAILPTGTTATRLNLRAIPPAYAHPAPNANIRAIAIPGTPGMLASHVNLSQLAAPGVLPSIAFTPSVRFFYFNVATGAYTVVQGTHANTALPAGSFALVEAVGPNFGVTAVYLPGTAPITPDVTTMLFVASASSIGGHVDLGTPVTRYPLIRVFRNVDGVATAETTVVEGQTLNGLPFNGTVETLATIGQGFYNPAANADGAITLTRIHNAATATNSPNHSGLAYRCTNRPSKL
jgi:hypothetical protein